MKKGPSSWLVITMSIILVIVGRRTVKKNVGNSNSPIPQSPLPKSAIPIDTEASSIGSETKKEIPKVVTQLTIAEVWQYIKEAPIKYWLFRFWRWLVLSCMVPLINKFSQLTLSEAIQCLIAVLLISIIVLQIQNKLK